MSVFVVKSVLFFLLPFKSLPDTLFANRTFQFLCFSSLFFSLHKPFFVPVFFAFFKHYFCFVICFTVFFFVGTLLRCIFFCLIRLPHCSTSFRWPIYVGQLPFSLLKGVKFYTLTICSTRQFHLLLFQHLCLLVYD